jgi:hypothetical protein
MADNSSGKSGGGELITTQMAGEIHPRGLLSAIGYIEQSYANERGGCLINPEFLTTPQRWEFMEVGLRSSIASGVALALLAPLAIAALESYIPVFGSYEPSFSDKFCSLLLTLIFSFGYSIFVASAAVKHLGGYSRAMVSNLVGGVAMASSIKAVIVFVAYHFIYFKVLSPTNITWILNHLYPFGLSYETALRSFAWIMDAKSVLITSSYFVFVSTLIFVLIPYAAMLYGHFRNQKLIAAGVVDVFKQN